LVDRILCLRVIFDDNSFIDVFTQQNVSMDRVDEHQYIIPGFGAEQRSHTYSISVDPLNEIGELDDDNNEYIVPPAQ
ncbi:MAG: hypothetical protein P8Z41_14745, partial [Anaerolineales bacterium]